MILPRILNLCIDGSIDLKKMSLLALNKIYNKFD